MFSSGKQMKVTMAVLRLSLRSPNVHLHAPSSKFPSDPCSTF